MRWGCKGPRCVPPQAAAAKFNLARDLEPCEDSVCKVPHTHEAHARTYDAFGRLQKAMDILRQRGEGRDQGSVAGERSMSRGVRIFNAWKGSSLSAADGWGFMLCLKMARMESGGYKEDDYDDALGYAALLAEETAAAQQPAPGCQGQLVAKPGPAS